MSAPRTARIERHTRETRIELSLDLDGASPGHIETSVPFLDHLLSQVARHGRLGLAVVAHGDVEADVHHLAEDLGIVLGEALDAALGAREGIERFGAATVPLDETLVEVVLDLSGRAGAYLEIRGERALLLGSPGVAIEHVEEFLAGLARGGRLTCHVRSLRGHNTHHQLESTAKALGRALWAATRPAAGGIPSTKGSL